MLWFLLVALVKYLLITTLAVLQPHMFSFKIMARPTLTIFYQFDPWQSSIGGIQTVVRNFVKYSLPEFKVRLVGISADDDSRIGQWHSRKLAGRQVDFLPLFRLANDDQRRLIPTSLRYAFALRNKPLASDFIHFHRIEPTLFTAYWPGQKTLFVHNDIHQQMQSGEAQGILWRRFPQLYFAFERRLMPQFDQVLSCNSESTALYQQYYPHLAERISFVRNSFDGDVFYPLPAAERHRLSRQQALQMDLPADTQFILFAGRLHPQKDPLLLLKALAHVSNPRAHLLVAGDGELAAAMAVEVERLNLAGRVTLLGAIGQAALANLHRIASLFVLTSAYEGLPLVVLEALACGTPVVTTNAGETPRLLHSDCGLVCRDRAPETIASAWETVLGNREQFPSTACVGNAQPYSAESVVKTIYKDMLRRWSSQHAVSARSVFN